MSERVAWTPFIELDREHWVRLYTERYGPEVIDAVGSDGSKIVPDRVFENSRYTVFLSDVPVPENWPAMWTLSIKHKEREPLRHWRDLQRIKNECVGPDHEAVELFPAEARLMDTANQYHLWVLKEPGLRFPFGFQDRRVADGSGTVTEFGTRQEPIEDPPPDAIPEEVMLEVHRLWMAKAQETA